MRDPPDRSVTVFGYEQRAVAGDSYTNGPHAILVSQQALNSVPTDSVAKRTVHVPGLGKGTASVAVGGPQVVFENGGADIVVKGNVDLDHLVAFARHLHLRKG